MTELLLCLEDTRLRAHARIGIADGAPRRLDCLRVLAPAVDAALANITANPVVRVHVHGTADGQEVEGIDAQRVELHDPRLLDELATVFEARGTNARLLPRRQSDAWLLLRELPLSDDVRSAMSMSLGVMPVAELEQMIALLEEGKRQLADLRATAKNELAAVDAQNAAELQKIEDDAAAEANGAAS